MRHKLLGKYWNIEFVSPSKLQRDKKTQGDCDSPTAKNKTIRISNKLTPKKEMEVIIHEALHACDWYKDEEWVETAAEDIARLLWKLGFTKSKDVDR